MASTSEGMLYTLCYACVRIVLNRDEWASRGVAYAAKIIYQRQIEGYGLKIK